MCFLELTFFWQLVPGATEYVIHWRVNGLTHWDLPLKEEDLRGSPGNAGNLKSLNDPGGFRIINSPGFPAKPENKTWQKWTWNKTLNSSGEVVKWDENAFLTEYDGYLVDYIYLPLDPATVTVEAFSIKNGVWSSNRYLDKTSYDAVDDFEYEKDKVAPFSWGAFSSLDFTNMLNDI